MKTIITSNWRPLDRALCTLLLGIAADWAMPKSAPAQLYNAKAVEVPSRKVKIKRHFSKTYFVLFTAALLINLYAAGYHLAFSSLKGPNFPVLLATINVFVTILVRNEIFLNVLYRVLVKACSPLQLPIAIKNRVTSGLLHLGGIHAGCAVASLVWLAIGLFYRLSEGPADKRWVNLPLLSAMLACLTIMCVTALPAVRRRYHDLFEHTHRFLGWSALLLLWANVLLTANDSPQAGAVGPLAAMPKNASFWLTVAITALVLSPWLTVRRVQVQARVLSRAVTEITFPGGSEPGAFGRISRHPLADWHAFALFAGTRGAVSHSMVISGLGDFTKGLIITPPAALYVRTVKFPGLPCCVPMYRRSIIIATGTGMVPYLSLLTILPRGSHRLIWIGRSFRECFGSNLCDFVFQWPDVVLVDTTSGARPDVTALAVAHYRSFEADAVFVGSNPEGTSQIVSGCRALGIPAFGPSWDS
jgi:hypothetical protein